MVYFLLCEKSGLSKCFEKSMKSIIGMFHAISLASSRGDQYDNCTNQNGR